VDERGRRVRSWEKRSGRALQSARLLLDAGDYFGCANRAYYAAYQAATSVCVAHGDEANFPTDWNNPTHEQLPGLISNNGTLSSTTRREVRTHLRFLRQIREDADYRPGKTVNREISERCVRFAATVLNLLDVDSVIGDDDE
jgi:uncharacterized protein (UPF0332 family)